MVTKDAILKALDKPRKIFPILKTVDPAGREENLQALLMAMRERGQVRFDIKKGVWSRF